MAVTVTTDLVVRHALDATGATLSSIGNVGAPNAADTNIKVQGTASGRSSGVTNTGLGGVGASFSSADFTALHVLCWVNDLDKVDTVANGGWRIRIASTLANLATNFGEWTVGGQETYIAPISGFQRWCIDCNRPFDFVTGTPPALSGVLAIGMVGNHLTASTRATWFSDSYDTATGITVVGGTSGAGSGNSGQIASDDLTNGRGIFKSVGGAYYILGRVTIGDVTGANTSDFSDSNEIWVFENQNVSATFHLLQFVGTAGAGAKNAKLGSKSGTGTATEAAGGNSVKAAGLSPFSIEAISSGINVGLYGCSFTNPVAQKEDAPRAVQYATAANAFTNVTRAAGNATANDFLLMPASEATGDYCVFGHNAPFSSLKLTIGTAGVGGTVAWEYWNGSAWTALSDVTDGTSSFTATAGTNSITFAIPDDWATTTLNSLGPHYYIRSKVTATYSTNPNGTQAFCVMGGRVRLEASTAEAIRCTFTNMDTIRVRNGAFLKKSVITNSVAPAKSAALDLGSADPSADTVRDLTIQNCSKGILLKGTSTGTTTYNFRNIKFAGNTNDVRVDFPAGATIVINVLEGGSTPSVDNVNSSTVTINNTVTVKVTVQDSTTFAAIQNARVLLEANTGGALPVAASVTITRSGSVATVAHTAHGMLTGQNVVIRGANELEYNVVAAITVTGTGSYTYTVAGTPATPATGTITSTAVILSGLTDASGIISDAGFNFGSNQPVIGKARKGSSAPYYRTASIVGTITSAGFDNTTLLVTDQ